MQAIQVTRHCEPAELRLTSVPDPEPRADEALVEIKACGMNHLDLWVRKGVPGHEFPLPLVLGCDGAGVIRAKGAAVPESFNVGQRVALSPGVSCNHCLQCQSGKHNLCRQYGVLGETRDGTNAALIAVSSMNLLPMPDAMSFEDAAATPLVFLTAWHMLVERARIAPGQWVLIHGAGSGVSIAAIQIAKLYNATVIATTSSAEKIDKARALGADHVINYRTQNVGDEVKRLTAKAGVEIVVDHVGEKTWDTSIGALAKGGVVVTCGTTSGSQLTTHGQRLFFKTLGILGSTMGGRGDMMRVFQHVSAGRLKPVIDRAFPLKDAAAAHAYLERGEQFGKVLLIP